MTQARAPGEDGADALIQLAQAYREPRPRVALGLCRLGNRRFGDDPRFAICLATVAGDSGRYADSAAWYAAAIRLAPDEATLYDEALERIGSFIEHGLFDSDPDQARALAHHAREIIEARARRFPDTPPSVEPWQLDYLMGVLETHAGRPAEARAHLEASIQAHEAPEAILQLGLLSERTGELESALGLYRRALDLTPERAPSDALRRAEILEHLGDAYRQSGEASQATRMYQQAFSAWDGAVSQLEGAPLALAQLRRGVLLGRLGRANDSRSAFAEAMAAGSSVLVTSGGFTGTSRGTYASLVVRPVAEDEDGKKRAGGYWAARRHLGALEGAAAVGEEAARRTLRKLGATKLDTTELPVVFDPDAGRAILGLVASCVRGGAIWRKSSYLAGRLHSKVASELVTIVDDPLIPRAPGSRAFDGEGLLSRKNVVVDAGMLESYLLDSYSARKLEMKSTASASRGASGGVGASTSNFILQRGNSTVDDLIGSTKRGLYVTEMMGFGFNAVTGDFSRGAAGFLIEDGELTRPINEVTISLPLDDLLQRIDAVADDLDQRTAIATPTFRVSAMTVAGR
jgi:PmbA protein